MNVMEHFNRSSDGCLCCGSTHLKREATVVSAFLAKRGWNGRPELTSVMFCDRCGFRFYDRGLSESECNNYYQGYRDVTYFKDRNHYEPFYTRSAYNGDSAWMKSKGRRVALAHALEQAGAPHSFQAALDYGGGTGQMLLDVDSPKRVVFDVSGGETESGVAWIGSEENLGNNWDLVLSCQVLEHLSDPFSSVQLIASILSKGGWFYAEVPYQHWSNSARSGPVRQAWLSWIVDKPRLLVAADTLSTVFRVKCGFLPPMGFIPMREHLNYFTEEALCALMQKAGLTVKWFGRNLENAVCAVAQRA
jgi:hypothetical protein